MRNPFTAAAVCAFLLGAAAVLAAQPSTADVGMPDVRGTPDVQGPAEVGAASEQPSLPVDTGAVAGRAPSRLPSISLPSAKAPAAGSAVRGAAIPSASFGAGLAVRFGDEEAGATEATFLSTYLEFYPFVFQQSLGVGFTISCDVVPVDEGDLVVGSQADLRFVYVKTKDFNSWLDVRVGPAYEMVANSLRLYGYADIGFDLDLGGMLLETRLGGFLTGTTGGVSVCGGIQL
jgi:hypothetical protein